MTSFYILYMLYHQLINEDKFYVTKAKLLFFFLFYIFYFMLYLLQRMI